MGLWERHLHHDTEVEKPMTVTTALILFITQAVFTMAILVFGTMAAAGMLSREERAERVARRAQRKRRVAEKSSRTSRKVPAG